MSSSSIKVIYFSQVCSHTFVSTEMDSKDPYPTVVLYACPQCDGKNHSFNARSSFLISTPKKKASFEAYCKSLNITDLDVYVKK